jgi:hypothetical protein
MIYYILIFFLLIYKNYENFGLKNTQLDLLNWHGFIRIFTIYFKKELNVKFRKMWFDLLFLLDFNLLEFRKIQILNNKR